MLSSKILGGLLVFAVGFGYMAHTTDEMPYLIGAIISIVLIVGVYILAPQINWWWYNRHPQDIPPSLRKIIETRMPFYKVLSPDDQEKFRHRLGLFIMGNQFIAQGPDADEVPEDIKLIIAANACQVTLGESNLILPKFENVVVYAHPFPSPQYVDWHISEVFEEDGVLLFSAEHLLKSFMDPHSYFNIGVYEYLKAFKINYPKYLYPIEDSVKWSDIQLISNFEKEKLEHFIGLKDLDKVAVLMTLYFTHPIQFKKQKPYLYKQIGEVFRR